MRMIPKALAEPARQMRAHGFHIVEQPVAGNDLLNGERGGTGHRMADIGVAVLEEP